MKLKLLALAVLIGVVFNSAITFFLAFFSESKAVTIYVNKFHEANIEFVFFSLAVIGCIYFMYHFAKNKSITFD